MLQQFEFLPTDSPAPMILYWIIIFVLSLSLINLGSMSKRRAIFISLITIFFAGVLLGGIPNVVLPIEYTLNVIASNGDLISVLHPLAIGGIIMGSSLVVGRIFCSFACPLGSLQELASQMNFLSTNLTQKGNTSHIEVSSRLATNIRWVFLGILILSSLGGISFFSEINPLSGFLLTLSLSLFSVIIISIASVFFYRPWCRFLCPFGAGSAFCGQFATIKYRRTNDCTDCGKCEDVCPTQEAAADSKKGECYFCNRCIEVCPHDAIRYDIEV